MTLIVFLAGLASAVLHAGWNAATRQRPEPGSAFAAVVMMSGFLSLPPLLWTGLPSRESLLWLGVGAVFNLCTMRLIMATYRSTPFAVGYPLMRGISPLAVALFGFALFGERLTAPAVGGIVAISTGVLMLAASSRFGTRVSGRGVLLALAAGLSNACFVVADARGVRASGDPLAYGLAVSFLNAMLLAGMQWLEKVDLRAVLRRDWGFTLAAACASTTSYLLVLYGFAHGPVGAVSALRETSVFFGILIAATVLKEHVGPLRWGAALLALAGIVLIRVS